MPVALVVVDVAAGEGGLVEMPDQKLFLQREVFQPIRVELNDGHVVDPFEEVFSCAIGVRLSISGRGQTTGDERHNDQQSQAHHFSPTTIRTVKVASHREPNHHLSRPAVRKQFCKSDHSVGPGPRHRSSRLP